MVCFSTLQTPLGPLALVYDMCAGALAGLRIALCEFSDPPGRLETSLKRFYPALTLPAETPAPVALTAVFERYFSGDLQAFRALETAPVGSALEQLVWGALRHIPPGETRSYAQIAIALGGVASGRGLNARTVGLINARNPIAIIVPCHRVIAADGGLAGYAGGLARKQWLLRHEGGLSRQGELF